MRKDYKADYHKEMINSLYTIIKNDGGLPQWIIALLYKSIEDLKNIDEVIAYIKQRFIEMLSKEYSDPLKECIDTWKCADMDEWIAQERAIKERTSLTENKTMTREEKLNAIKRLVCLPEWEMPEYLCIDGIMSILDTPTTEDISNLPTTKNRVESELLSKTN